MNIDRLEEKRALYHSKKKDLTETEALIFIKDFEAAFRVQYTHESTAIEGNTLTLLETSHVLINNENIPKKDLREIYEVVNHDEAFHYVFQCVKNKRKLNEETVKEIHRILVNHIFKGGIYRDRLVYIRGAKHEFTAPEKLLEVLKEFYQALEQKSLICGMPESGVNGLELACWTHAKFVGIHPFIDGNGRTSRLMMNYQLMSNGYLPISIPLDIKKEYNASLDRYHTTGDLMPFMELIYNLEENQLDEIIKNTKTVNKTKDSK